MDAIRRVSTVFTIDDSDHNRKLKTMNDQYRLTRSEIELAGKRMDAFGKSAGDLGFKQEALKKQVENLTNKTQLYRDSLEKVTTRAEENKTKLAEMKKQKDALTQSYQEAVKEYGKESEEAKKLKGELDELNEEYKESERVVKSNIDTANRYQTQLNKVEGELVDVQSELERVEAELKRQQDAWIKSGEALQVAGEKMQKVGDGMQTVGKNLSMYVTLPLVAMGTAAVNEAVKFESAFAGVKKTVDGTSEQIDGLRQSIIDMSKEIPSTTEEISKVAEAAGQLGIETDNIADFTRVIIDLGNATNIVGDEGASQIAKFANIVGMSQKDFDRFGSSIVDLGNNFATTEADILSMAMRLAASGKQAGMTEAQILGIATSLSSVGIEAEAGGSAWSKFSNTVQLAVETGNSDLKEYAKIAGMTGKEFKKAFEQDAAGALVAFVKGLKDTERNGKSAIQVLDEMDISEVRLRDTLLRASGASDIFTKAIDTGTKAWSENVALTNEAEQRYATTESQMKILKNEIADLGRGLGEQLLPLVKDGMIFLSDLIQGFKDLSPQTQENIVKFGLMAAAAGPLLNIGGKLVSGTGSLISAAGELAIKIGGSGGLTAATSGLSTVAGTAGGAAGLGGLTTGLGGVIAAAAPYVLAIGGIVGAGIGLYEILDQDVIPTVDLFADHMGYARETITDDAGNISTVVTDLSVTISDETKTQVGAFMDLDKNARFALSQLYMGATELTGTGWTEMRTNIVAGIDMILGDLDTYHANSIEALSELFNDNKILTIEEMAAIRKIHEEDYAKQEEDLTASRARIQEIMDTANRENRNLTISEQNEINRILDESAKKAVNIYATSEAEKNVILNRLAASQERITAEMVGDTIKQLNAQRDETIRIASEERDKKVMIAEETRQKGGAEAEALANKMIEEANRQYDEIVRTAEGVRDDGVNKIINAYNDLADKVDKKSGKILTAWDKVKNWWNSWTPEPKSATITTYTENVYSSRPGYTGDSGPGYGANRPGYALGTSHAIGGLTKVNERGYELIDLPVGSRVRNHVSSEQMIKDIVTETAKALLDNNNSTTVTQNIYVPVASPYELARRTKKELENMALGF